MELLKGRCIESGGLDDLHFANKDVFERIDSVALLFDFLSNGVGDELRDQLFDVSGGDLAGDHFEHLLADLSDLGTLGIAGLLELVLSSLGKGDAKESEGVSVGGVDKHISFNQSLPLSHERLHLVGGERHSVEIGEAVLSLDIINSELEFNGLVIFVLVQVSQGNFKHSSLESIGRVIYWQ